MNEADKNEEGEVQEENKNDVIVHIILSNLDFDGAQGYKNKLKMDEIKNRRIAFYKIQKELAVHDL